MPAIISMVLRSPKCPPIQPASGRHGAEVDQLRGRHHPPHQRARHIPLAERAGQYVAGHHEEGDQERADEVEDHPPALGRERDQQRGWAAESAQDQQRAGAAQPGGQRGGGKRPEHAAGAGGRPEHADGAGFQAQRLHHEQHQQGAVAGEPEIGDAADQGEDPQETIAGDEPLAIGDPPVLAVMFGRYLGEWVR